MKKLVIKRTEHDVQSLMMLALSSVRGVKIFRNNTAMGWAGQIINKDAGTVTISNARPIHAGLIVGSSDLIGWKTVTITPDMVGKEVAVFVAVEVKKPKGKNETKEQDTFLKMVSKSGGIAGVARSNEDALNLIESI